VKFRCERDTLSEVLSTAGRAVATRAGRSGAMEGLRLQVTGDRLEAVGTDFDMTIRVSAEVSGSNDGACVAHARLVSDAVRAVEPGAVDFELADDEIRISRGRTNYSFRTFPVEDFPKLAEVQSDPLTCPAGDLAGALGQVVRAASSDDARPALTGVLMAAEAGGLRLVATDGYRLARRDLPGTSVLAEGQQVLVPSRSLAELSRLLTGRSGDVSIRLGEHDATFEVGTTTLTTRLLVGQFPNYANLIPANPPNRLTIGREPLLDALKRVRILVKDLTSHVRLTPRPDGVELTVINQEFGRVTEDVEAKYEGTDMVIGFNPGFLMEGVEAVEGDEVVIEITDAVKAAVVHGTDSPEFLYLLMPTRPT
jgi:DNA polymerase III subunit beta